MFNIGGGYNNSLSLIELLDFLENSLELPKLNYIKISRRDSDQDVFVASITKAKQILGWEPVIDYKKGISDMLNWCKDLIK